MSQEIFEAVGCIVKIISSCPVFGGYGGGYSFWVRKISSEDAGNKHYTVSIRRSVFIGLHSVNWRHNNLWSRYDRQNGIMVLLIKSQLLCNRSCKEESLQ